MAWTTPVTDRKGPEPKTTAADMNRISGNLNFLTAGTLKSNYTNADIVLKADWEELVETAQQWDGAVTGETTWQNFNQIEAAAKEAHDGSIFPGSSRYPSETLYPTDE